ncbi:hypothetical protein [Actinoplanes philippinensis]|uniref:hypothetical protein n=1 Tax=Actinoplanes philippinensis TaxID=35752 RepID=UPI0033FC9D9F
MNSFERVKVIPAASDDIRGIGDTGVQRAVISALLMVEENLTFGVPLESLSYVGDLRGCRKIYVDEPGDFKPRYRIVYWLAPSEKISHFARVIAVGRREDLRAYEIAVQRYNADRNALGLRPVEEMTDSDLGLAG